MEEAENPRNVRLIRFGEDLRIDEKVLSELAQGLAAGAEGALPCAAPPLPFCFRASY